MSEATQLRVPPPLPETTDDLWKQYKLKPHRNINELVQDIIVKLWDQNEEFMKYINAIYDSEAIEGSMAEDDVMAALIIRNVATKDKNERVATAKVRTIKLAMRVVLRRFDIDRNRRFDMAELPSPNSHPETTTTAAE